MRKIGVLGGTFDPIHFGHMYIAYEAYKKLGLEEIIFMPGGNPPHKRGNEVTDGILRYEMVEKAISDYSFFTISDYEIRKETLSYTYETLRYLKETNKDSELYFITGADCLINIDKWRNVQNIMETCNFVVFKRPGYSKNEIISQKEKVEERYNTNIIYLDLLNMEISSSLIRDRVRAGLCIDFFVPINVRNIISKENLYK
ncbi:nicotinate-nucleotide adenylyltransferase [Clostridium cavendishii DSM 21758]|uniref:Probable nicotinate-nucleotide adenylyltransferase n=1 Tax=Clostridium cavendishii DSM 21758 TaxID=1121302 RepID=A0A1M6BHX8_9CLOT|nr:nicotinate-nucleotide adenylyltransferase [Clostridium cavendishii]SHI48311.1 nicotinate-nucleotide adenylyltransferase [Clostridium cavendishii DSM 21758]